MSKPISYEQLKRQFPNASEDFLRTNSSQGLQTVEEKRAKGSALVSRISRKKRAAYHLVDALKSGSLSIQPTHATGTDITSSLSKIYLYTLVSYLETTGISYKEKLSPAKRGRKKKKKQS